VGLKNKQDVKPAGVDPPAFSTKNRNYLQMMGYFAGITPDYREMKYKVLRI
jgi:hypothetical protein